MVSACQPGRRCDESRDRVSGHGAGQANSSQTSTSGLVLCRRHPARQHGPSGRRSVIFVRPRYQDGVTNGVGNQRALPYISMGRSLQRRGRTSATAWRRSGRLGDVFCGTSESGPLFPPG
jgi:hypothetical protein